MKPFAKMYFIQKGGTCRKAVAYSVPADVIGCLHFSRLILPGVLRIVNQHNTPWNSSPALNVSRLLFSVSSIPQISAVVWIWPETLCPPISSPTFADLDWLAIQGFQSLQVASIDAVHSMQKQIV